MSGRFPANDRKVKDDCSRASRSTGYLQSQQRADVTIAVRNGSFRDSDLLDGWTPRDLILG